MLGPHPRGQQLLSCFPHILQVPRGGQEGPHHVGRVF